MDSGKDEAQIEAIRRLLAIVDAYQLQELVVDSDGLRVTIRGETSDCTAWSSPPAGEEGAVVPATESSAVPVEDAAYYALRSPMTGIFYRSSAPDAPPLVVEDQWIEQGQPVGLIEAMKVFSEIPADVAGRVIRVVADSGKLLQEGDPLLYLDTAEQES